MGTLTQHEAYRIYLALVKLVCVQESRFIALYIKLIVTVVIYNKLHRFSYNELLYITLANSAAYDTVNASYILTGFITLQCPQCGTFKQNVHGFVVALFN